jgi:hypothetical protein
MTESGEYTVGRGRPPLQTRFKKGQSGNPSGKPGPAKLLKARFERALCQALEGSVEELERAKPDTAVAAMAHRMVLDATAGRTPAQRLLLSALDAGAKGSDAEDFSLVQGKKQGSPQITAQDLLDLIDQELTAAEQRTNVARSSLVQGEKQGSAQTSEPAGGDSIGCAGSKGEGGEEANSTAPFSLVQGKKQGNGKNSTAPVYERVAADEALRQAGAEARKRTELMSGAAAIPRGGAVRARPPAGK